VDLIYRLIDPELLNLFRFYFLNQNYLILFIDISKYFFSKHEGELRTTYLRMRYGVIPCNEKFDI